MPATNNTADAATEVSGQAFLKSLRARTAASHEALEAHPYSQSITTPDITMDAYVRYLHMMQQVVAGMEAALYPELGEIVPDMDKRQKGRWLEEDLGFLHAADNPFPPFRLIQQAQAVPFAFGAFYVLEGSTLGGRVILKSLLPALPVTAEQGAKYFAGYGIETGPLWQHFLQSLCRYAVAHDCGEDVIVGAQSAYAGIIDYFNSCQAQEAGVIR